MPTEQPQENRARWERWTFVAILLIAILVRIRGIERHDFWLDEFWTVELSTGRGSVHLDLPHDVILEPPPRTTQLDGAPPWWTVWTSMERVTHPPLYFLVLRIWREAVGETDVAARLLSVCASVVALVILWDLGRTLIGPKASLWAAALFAVAWPQVEYAQQARNYALLTALALGMLWAIVMVRGRGWTWSRGAILFISTLGTLLTHYFAAGTVLAMFLATLLCLRGRTRLLAGTAMVLAGTLFLAAWGPFMWEQRHVFQTTDPTTSFLMDPQPGHFWRTLLRLASQPGQLMVPLRGQLQWLTLAAAPLWLWTLAGDRRDRLLPPWLWMTGTIAVIAALDFSRGTKHLDYPRYTLLAGPGAYLLAAAALTSITPARWRWLGYTLAATLTAASLSFTFFTHREWRDYGTLAAIVDQRASASDVLVFAAPDAPQEWTVGALYLGFDHYSDGADCPVLLLRNRPLPGTVERLRRATRVWLISESQAPPETVLPGFKAVDGGYAPGYPAGIWLMQWSGL